MKNLVLVLLSATSAFGAVMLKDDNYRDNRMAVHEGHLGDDAIGEDKRGGCMHEGREKDMSMCVDMKRSHMNLDQGRPKDMETDKMSMDRTGTMNKDKLDLPMDKNLNDQINSHTEIYQAMNPTRQNDIPRLAERDISVTSRQGDRGAAVDTALNRLSGPEDDVSFTNKVEMIRNPASIDTNLGSLSGPEDDDPFTNKQMSMEREMMRKPTSSNTNLGTLNGLENDDPFTNKMDSMRKLMSVTKQGSREDDDPFTDKVEEMRLGMWQGRPVTVNKRGGSEDEDPFTNKMDRRPVGQVWDEMRGAWVN